MFRRALFVTLVAGAAACGGHTQSEPARTCDAAAQRAVDAMINQAKKRLDKPGLPDDVKQRILARMKKLEGTGAKMRGVITNRCVEDKWSSAVIECWTKSDELEAIRACRKQLPPDANARLQKDELEIFVDAPDGADQPTVPAPGADRRLEMLDRAIADATQQVAAAKDAAALDAARAQLTALQAERQKLEAERAALHPGPAPDATSNQIATLMHQLDELDQQVAKAVQQVAGAQSQADLEAAKKQLEQKRAEKAALEQQLAAAHAAAGSGSAKP